MEAPLPGGEPLIAHAFSPLLRFLRWFFGERAAGLDIVLAFPAAGWAALLIVDPPMFSRGNWANIALLPPPAWLAIMLALALAHALCIVVPLRWLRVSAAAASAWVWLFIAYAIGRHGITPGTIAHIELGMIALLGGLHVYGLREAR